MKILIFKPPKPSEMKKLSKPIENLLSFLEQL